MTKCEYPQPAPVASARFERIRPMCNSVCPGRLQCLWFGKTQRLVMGNEAVAHLTANSEPCVKAARRDTSTGSIQVCCGGYLVTGGPTTMMARIDGIEE